MGTSFIDVISGKISDNASRERSAFEASMAKAVEEAFPELSFPVLCQKLSDEQVRAVQMFLQLNSYKGLCAAVKRKTLKFAGKDSAAKVTSLRKKGFPEGDFTWRYAGVTDYGTESTVRCSLSGHPIRYGHMFTAKGAPSLCLSSGSASSLYGVAKEVFDSLIYSQSGLLEEVAGVWCACNSGKASDYLRLMAGAAGTYLLQNGMVSVMDLMPFYVDESVFGAVNSEDVLLGGVIQCKLLTGTVVLRTYDWVKEHIYSCMNADLDESLVRLVPLTLASDCASAMNAMWDPLVVANELCSARLVPPEALCAVINQGLSVGLKCHRLPCAETDFVIEDVKDNWKYSINGAVLTLEKYIGTNPDLVVRNTYMAEGKKFTKVALMEPKAIFGSNGGVESFDAGAFVKNKGLRSIVFEEGILLPEKCRYMFWGCSSLESLDLSNFDISRVTDMYAMFAHCSSLKSLDLSSFDTSSVTDMNGMFYKCGSLESLNLSSFDTSRVTNMHFMFDGCCSLKSLDLSNFDTSKVTDMAGMFDGCSSLESLDLSHFDTSSGPDMRWMFKGCRSLKSLDLSNFDTSRVTDMWEMFDGSVIGTLYFWGTRSDWDALERRPKSVGTVVCKDDEEVKDNWEYSINGDVLTLEKYIGTNPDVVVRNTYMAGGKKFTKVALMETKVTFDSGGGVKSIDAGVFVENTGLKSIVFEEGILLPENCAWLFFCCSSLESLDLRSFDTSSVTNMRAMFRTCKSLKSLDLSHFDTSSVTNMNGMFSCCKSLEALDLSHFDTSSVTDMRFMFDVCSSLESLDLSSFDTSSVTAIWGMFRDCISLESLDLCHFDTSKVTNMRSMFYYCESLKSLDLSSFDTSSVTDMDFMFQDCRSLKSLDLSHFDTLSVTTMSWMLIGSVIGTLYFWGTRSDWDSLVDKPRSVGTLICKDDSPSKRIPAYMKSVTSKVSASKSDRARVLCTIRLSDALDLSSMSSVPTCSGRVSGDSDIAAYVDESDPTLMYLWVPVDMVPMVAGLFSDVGVLDHVSDSGGRVLQSYGGTVSASEIDVSELELRLDLGLGDYESEGYKRLYALVDDAYSFFTCDVAALRASGGEYAGKTELVIRRSHLKEVKALKPAQECELYARELRFPLPAGVQLSDAGLSVLRDYEVSHQSSRVVLKVLRTECYNAGLLFTASSLLRGVLELLREDDVRGLLRDASETMLVNSLVSLLSNYQLVRSEVLTILVGLYRMVEARGVDGLRSRIAKLYNLAKAGVVPSKKLSVQEILDSAKG